MFRTNRTSGTTTTRRSNNSLDSTHTCRATRPAMLGEALERRTLFTTVPIVGPMVVSAEFDATAAPHAVHVQFTEDVWASLDTSDLMLVNELGRFIIPSELMTLHWDASTNTASFVMVGLEDGGVLPEGRWRATLLSEGIFNSDGQPLDGDADAIPGGDHGFTFHFLRGDANQDGTVDLKDFATMIGNFGQSSRNFTHGDFNYDGTVNLTDVGIFANRFGTSLIEPTTPTQFGQSATGSSDEILPL